MPNLAKLATLTLLLAACATPNTESGLISRPIVIERPASSFALAMGDAEPKEAPPLPEMAIPEQATTPEVVDHALEGDPAPLLPNGLSNPMPGGFLAGYHADTGLDIAGLHQPVFALAAGTIEYAEGGHTLWNGRHDDPFAIRLKLDHPLSVGDHQVTHLWYAHLSRMDFDLPEGTLPRIHVEAGQRLGISGIARGSPHLHLGMLLDGKVEQEWGTFLDEADVRRLLGNFPTKTRLPSRSATPRDSRE